MAVSAWLGKTKATYFGNATAKRDFRSQLRGNKALFLWAGYVAVLVFAVAVSYYTTMTRNEDSSFGGGMVVSIALVQKQLHDFYQIVLGLLAVVISLVTPALTAGSIVAERQRRSLDLVFSGPIEPKYLLIGKMISSYRYTIMLLVLSLPITATCVVMGGATWGDVLSSYILLSLAGLVLTAIGLLFSTLCDNQVAAVIWTYIACAAYLAATGGMAWICYTSAVEISHTPTPHWIAGLSPFAVQYVSSATQSVAGHDIPGWIFVGVISFLIVKLLLLGAGSALSPVGSKETLSLRLHGIVYSFAFCFVFIAGLAMVLLPQLRTLPPPSPTMAMGSFGSAPPPLPTPPDVVGALLAKALECAAILFFPIMGSLVCYGRDGGFKHSNDGRMSWRQIFTGRPSGGLPYLMVLFLTCFLGVFLAYWWKSGEMPDTSFLYGGVWALGFLALWWGAGRFVSSLAGGYKMAQVLQYGIVLVLLGLPVPIMSILNAQNVDMYTDQSRVDYMVFQPFYPIYSDPKFDQVWVYGVIMLFAGIVLMAFERNARGVEVRYRT